MNDRELLELAAKAAGYPQGTSRSGGGLLMANDLYWNPLTDGGDALRLAVKLRLDICRTTAEADAVCVWLDHACDFIEEPHGSDPYVATCRAIVRAAAEIGKVIKQPALNDLLEDNYYKSQAEAFYKEQK